MITNRRATVPGGRASPPSRGRPSGHRPRPYRPGGASLARERRPDPRAEGWLAAAKQGSQPDFVRLCERWEGPLSNFLTSYCKGDATTAQDLVQETFVTAWQKLEEVKDSEHLRAWLYRVARFKAINWLRKHHPRGRVAFSSTYAADRGLDVEGDGFDPLVRAMTVEPDNPWIPAVHASIAELPAIYIAVVRLHYLRRLTAREISLLLGINLTTVKMRLLRARQLLKPILLRKMGREP